MNPSGSPDLADRSGQSEAMIDLPLVVTKGNVKLMWRIQCAAPNTLGFVAYRGSTSSTSEPTYLQSAIPLHPTDFSHIEVKAGDPGLYVLQLRATR